jgi:hypothetical protein
LRKATTTNGDESMSSNDAGLNVPDATGDEKATPEATSGGAMGSGNLGDGAVDGIGDDGAADDGMSNAMGGA